MFILCLGDPLISFFGVLQLDMTDFYDDDYDLDTDDEVASDAGSDYQDGDDSGNGES